MAFNHRNYRNKLAWWYADRRWRARRAKAEQPPVEEPEVYSHYTFDAREPLIDLDFETNHFRVGANEYTSLDDFVAAGWTPTAWGGHIDISALGLVNFTMRAVGTTGPSIPTSTTTPLYMCAIDDNDATASEDIAFLGWTSASRLQASARRNNITTLDGVTAAAIPINSDAIVVGRFATNNFAMSANFSDPAIDSSGANMLGPLRLMVGGRITDNTRIWNGQVKRVTVWDYLFTNGEVHAATRHATAAMPLAYAGFVSPMGTIDGPHLYMGGNHKFGQFALKYRTENKQLIGYKKLTGNYAQVDDHNPAACIKTPGGAYLWGYTGHGVNTWINFRRSTTTDVADAAPEVAVSTAAIGTASYMQLRVHQPTGHIYAIFRASDYKWAFSVSTDDGVTWSAPRTVSQHATVKCYTYAEFLESDNDTMLFVVNENSQLGEAVMRIATWNVVTGDITTGSGVMFNTISNTDVTVGAQMENMSAFVQVPEHSGSCQGYGNWGEEFVYSLTNTTLQQDEGMYHYAKYSGTGSIYDPANWQITPIVSSGPAGGTQGRWIGSLCISREATANPRLYISRRVGSNWLIEQWDATDANGTAFNNTKQLASVADTNYTVAFRPHSPMNADSNVPVFWMEGMYQDFDNFDLQVRFPE